MQASRPWRKIHAPWLWSQRLSKVSDGALILWHMLIQAQDDRGCFVWNPTAVRQLTAVRDWNLTRASRLLSELAAVGSVSVIGSVVTIYKGREFNGPPNDGAPSWKAERVYQENTDTSHDGVRTEYVPNKESGGRQSLQCQDSIATEIEIEKEIEILPPIIPQKGDITSEQKLDMTPQSTGFPNSKSPRQGSAQAKAGLTDEMRARLTEEFSPLLGGAEAVADEIELAMSHRSAARYKRLDLYVRNWLKRSAAWHGGPAQGAESGRTVTRTGPSASRHGGRGPGTTPDYEAEAKRVAASEAM